MNTKYLAPSLWMEVFKSSKQQAGELSVQVVSRVICFQGLQSACPQREQSCDRHFMMGTQPCQPHLATQPMRNVQNSSRGAFRKVIQESRKPVCSPVMGRNVTVPAKSLPESWWPERNGSKSKKKKCWTVIRSDSGACQHKPAKDTATKTSQWLWQERLSSTWRQPAAQSKGRTLSRASLQLLVHCTTASPHHPSQKEEKKLGIQLQVVQ